MKLIDAEGIRIWIDDDDGKLYASDGTKRFYVYLMLHGNPRFVVRNGTVTSYDGWDIADAVKTYNDL